MRTGSSGPLQGLELLHCDRDFDVLEKDWAEVLAVDLKFPLASRD